MSGFRRSGDGARIRLAPSDASLLGTLARQVVTLVSQRIRGEGPPDPATDRLFPDAYRDNDEFAAEFRRFTEDELGEQKIRNAKSVAETLNEARLQRIAEGTTGSKKISIELDAAGVQAWLRWLTDIRLILGDSLEITDHGLPGAVDDEETRIMFNLFTWLGLLQESLVHAIDHA